MSVVLPIEDDPRFRIYTASEGQKTFAIPFPFQDDIDVGAYADVGGAWAPIPLSDYSMTGAGQPTGGTITLNTGRANGDKILVLGEATLERLTSIVINGRFSSKANDDELDRNRIIQQEIRRDVDRTVKTSYGETAPTIDLGIPDGAVLIKQGLRLTAGPTGESINSAQDFATAAGNSATAAATSETNANTSAGQALASSNKAHKWAEEPEDNEVEPDAYSAKHWAAKAEQVVLDGLVDASVTIPKLAADVVNLIAGKVAFLASGVALPTSDIGPIWHADYAAIMTWQTFSANGASYAGYASVDIGKPEKDGQSAARAGWLKRNGGSYSKTTYAPLWNWALHNGRVVTLGSWTAGPYVFADNGNGTFKLPDNRAEFERLWDDGRGVDSGRAFGSWQNYMVESHAHVQNVDATANTGGGIAPRGSTPQLGNFDSNASTDPYGGAETRPRSVALLGIIKF